MSFESISSILDHWEYLVLEEVILVGVWRENMKDLQIFLLFSYVCKHDI